MEQSKNVKSSKTLAKKGCTKKCPARKLASDAFIEATAIKGVACDPRGNMFYLCQYSTTVYEGSKELCEEHDVWVKEDDHNRVLVASLMKNAELAARCNTHGTVYIRGNGGWKKEQGDGLFKHLANVFPVELVSESEIDSDEEMKEQDPIETRDEHGKEEEDIEELPKVPEEANPDPIGDMASQPREILKAIEEEELIAVTQQVANREEPARDDNVNQEKAPEEPSEIEAEKFPEEPAQVEAEKLPEEPAQVEAEKLPEAEKVAVHESETEKSTVQEDNDVPEEMEEEPVVQKAPKKRGASKRKAPTPAREDAAPREKRQTKKPVRYG